MKPLHTKYRPKTFDEIIGNKNIVACLRGMFEKRSHPHVFLFYGERGCGKSSFARAIGNELNCQQVTYYNAANEKGIETAREIIDSARYRPFRGENKLFIIDECFAKGTKIKTPDGERNIEKLLEGDAILNIAGISTIQHIFKNKVDLNRVCKLTLTNNEVIYTTTNHLFLTDSGWIEAKNLGKRDLLLTFSSDIMNSIISENFSRKDFNEEMQTLQKEICSKKINTRNVFKTLLSTVKKFFIEGIQSVQILWEKDVFEKEFSKKMLQSILCSIVKTKRPYLQTENFYKRKEFKNFNWFEEFYQNQSVKSRGDISKKFKKNEKKKSCLEKGSSGENINNKTNQRNTACLERRAWWKWENSGTSKKTLFSSWMENGICNFFRGKKGWLSNMLQSRYCKSKIKNCNRSRWENASVEKGYAKRFKKDKNVTKVRVENIEVYQQGSNDESFKNIIANQERNQGFIEFFDLQIFGHPSYFANNCLVHNCHKTTENFQNAILNVLEETPSHCYFVLCTTNPEKVLGTVKDRCHQFEVRPWTAKETSLALNKTAKREKKEVSEKIINKIVELSAGNPRISLVLLEKFISMGTSGLSEELLQQEDEVQIQINKLCQALMNGEGWDTVQKIISRLFKQDTTKDPESIRRNILAYFNAVALNKRSPDKRLILLYECFKEPLYNTGKAGLTFACMYSLI